MKGLTVFFKALTQEGQKLHGLYRVDAPEDGSRILKRLGLEPLSLFRVSPVLAPLLEAPGRKGVSAREMAVLMRQFATMYRSGVPLTKILDTLEGNEWTPELTLSVRIMGRSVHAGMTLSDSMRLCPQIFSSATIALIRTGEISGRLGEALDNCADILENESATSQRVGAALTYPAFTFGLFSIAVLLMAFLVLPRFAEVLRGFGRQLPLPAELLMIGAEWAFQPWVLFILLETAVLGAILARSWLRTESGRRALEGLLAKIPAVERFLKKMWLARLSFTLAALVDAGIPIVDAVKSTRSVVGSAALADSLDRAVDHMANGMDIATAFYTQGFPSTFVQLLKVGDESGQLVTLLGFVRRVYEEEVDATLSIFLSLLEPILLLVMGLCVCAFVLILLLPMVSIFGAIG